MDGVSTIIERFEKLIKHAPKKPRTDVPPGQSDQLAKQDLHAQQGNPAQAQQEAIPEEQVKQIPHSNKDKKKKLGQKIRVKKILGQKNSWSNKIRDDFFLHESSS